MKLMVEAQEKAQAEAMAAVEKVAAETTARMAMGAVPDARAAQEKAQEKAMAAVERVAAETTARMAGAMPDAMAAMRAATAAKAAVPAPATADQTAAESTSQGPLSLLRSQPLAIALITLAAVAIPAVTLDASPLHWPEKVAVEARDGRKAPVVQEAAAPIKVKEEAVVPQASVAPIYKATLGLPQTPAEVKAGEEAGAAAMRAAEQARAAEEAAAVADAKEKAATAKVAAATAKAEAALERRLVAEARANAAALLPGAKAAAAKEAAARMAAGTF